MHTFLLAAISRTATSTDVFGTALGYTVLLAWAVLTTAGFWRMLDKAEVPGWTILVPIYGYVKLLHIAGRSGWWMLLAFVPYLGLLTYIVLSLDLARAFGRGLRFGIGLLLLPAIFAPILGFGDAEYVGPVHAQRQTA